MFFLYLVLNCIYFQLGSQLDFIMGIAIVWMAI